MPGGCLVPPRQDPQGGICAGLQGLRSFSYRMDLDQVGTPCPAQGCSPTAPRARGDPATGLPVALSV